MSVLLQRVTSLRRRTQANAPRPRHLLRRNCSIGSKTTRAPRLDESIVQGVPGAEPTGHHCPV